MYYISRNGKKVNINEEDNFTKVSSLGSLPLYGYKEEINSPMSRIEFNEINDTNKEYRLREVLGTVIRGDSSKYTFGIGVAKEFILSDDLTTSDVVEFDKDYIIMFK